MNISTILFFILLSKSFTLHYIITQGASSNSCFTNAYSKIGPSSCVIFTDEDSNEEQSCAPGESLRFVAEFNGSRTSEQGELFEIANIQFNGACDCT